MIEIRRSRDRGIAENGWLHSRHTFSFGDYHDDRYMGYGVLRVINEDLIEGGTGFDTHGHRNMEIVSYVIDGALEHQDSMGNKTIIRPGEIQRMSAGSGVRHSEYNHFKDKQTHFLQIWILPQHKDRAPSYDQNNFESQISLSSFALIASQDGRDRSITLDQDVDIYVGKAQQEKLVHHELSAGRKLWIQVIRGIFEFNGEALREGDGAAIESIEACDFKMGSNTEFLCFDMLSTSEF